MGFVLKSFRGPCRTISPGSSFPDELSSSLLSFISVLHVPSPGSSLHTQAVTEQRSGKEPSLRRLGTNLSAGAELRWACDLLHQLLLSGCRLCSKIIKVPHGKVTCSFLPSPVASQLELFPRWAFGKPLLSQSHRSFSVSVPGLPFLQGPHDMSSPGEVTCVATILRPLPSMYS